MIYSVLSPHSQAPPSFCHLDRIWKSMGGPGIIYHMSDMGSSEKIERN